MRLLLACLLLATPAWAEEIQVERVGVDAMQLTRELKAEASKLTGIAVEGDTVRIFGEFSKAEEAKVRQAVAAHTPRPVEDAKLKRARLVAELKQLGASDELVEALLR